MASAWTLPGAMVGTERATGREREKRSEVSKRGGGTTGLPSVFVCVCVHECERVCESVFV